MRWIALAGMCVACGRVAFDGRDDAQLDTATGIDAQPCSPVGHDEDGDGFDDACDPCPQLAAAQLDSDGDGIGDDCDPGMQPHALTLFDPFTGPRADWIYDGRETFAGDAIQYRTIGTSVGTSLVQPPGRDTYELGGVVFAGAPTSRQISIQIGDVDSGAYYCELYDDNTNNVRLLLTYTLDGIAYMTIDAAPIGGPLESAPFRLVYEHAPPDIRCHAEWDGASYDVAGVIPGGLDADEAYIAFNQIEVDAAYFVRVSER